MLILELVAGLALLVLGGDLLVRGSVGLAERMKISPLLIGIVLVGFGTSTPELMTSLLAALNGSPGIAVGNVIGSNTANILLILGTAAIIFPMKADTKALMRDGLVVSAAALACLALAYLGNVSRLSGGLLVLALTAYLVFTYRAESGQQTPSADMHRAEGEAVTARPWTQSAPVLAALTIGGLIMTMLGAKFLVDSSVVLATRMGIDEAVIGLTVVALGTSLPELVTSVVAALRRQTDIAFGNILGSNIYNIFGILGVTAMVKPIEMPEQILSFDIWVMLAATALLMIFARTGHRICRLEGAALLGLYGLYLGKLALQ
ncbi:calcium/sodium antiporter [Roseibium polysiphoniae]|uniref:Calcium/sodium antiporter n=1 Tax=Roseibium polysiphoniae TaxID=2571221 RepID=A0ABR9C9C9_9HYPH|nr:calcium/sodium antiporter [Roseibium polysiphoniae]MBD8876511.1 calcium/sodium antiporter [Roseibium polysiphoniae]